MRLRPYKVIVALVFQETEGAAVLGEQETGPAVFYSAEKAIGFLADLDAHVAKLNGELGALAKTQAKPAEARAIPRGRKRPAQAS